MKSIKQGNFKDKLVFVRCDFNVSIQNGQVEDDFRIRQSLDTINYLQENGAKIILATHLGRPGGKKKEELSTQPIKERLEKLLEQRIGFTTFKNVKKIKNIKKGEIIFLENLRFEKGETENSEKFARRLSKLADFYVNDAFGVAHRAHASVVGVPEFLPSFAGLRLEEEVNSLSERIKNPKKPLTVIIGGAKTETKIKYAYELLDLCDHILFGGKIVSDILAVKGVCIGRSWPEEETVNIIKDIELTNPKIHMPVDVLVAPDKGGEIYTRQTAPGDIRKEENIYDIGEESIAKFSKIINESNTILWNGPMGVYENRKFEMGTQKIGEVIRKKLDAFSVAGGGDTIEALKKFNLIEGFSFISTGGGAMLKFLTGEKLPGLEALE